MIQSMFTTAHVCYQCNLSKVYPWAQGILDKVHPWTQGILTKSHFRAQGILDKMVEQLNLYCLLIFKNWAENVNYVPQN